MKYKLIVSDFDGTLNWYDDIVSQRQRTIEAIKAYRAKGGIFTLSTGRSYESLVDFLRAYDLHLVDVPVGCYNGAAIYSSATGELLTQYTITNDEAIRWVKHATLQNAYIQCYVDEKIYVNHINAFSKRYARGVELNFVEVGDLAKFLSETGYTPKKMLIMGMPDKISEIDHLYNHVYKKDFEKLTFLQSHATLWEIISAEASKGHIVKEISSMLNIPLSETICMGDNINDISMLEVAGLSVAVENARDEVKAIAKYHTVSCVDGGVATILEQAVRDELP